LTEYILHMSVTCLGDEDVTPLYEEYIQDSRPGDAEKAELTAIYRSLHSVPSIVVPRDSTRNDNRGDRMQTWVDRGQLRLLRVHRSGVPDVLLVTMRDRNRVVAGHGVGPDRV